VREETRTVAPEEREGVLVRPLRGRAWGREFPALLRAAPLPSHGRCFLSLVRRAALFHWRTRIDESGEAGRQKENWTPG